MRAFPIIALVSLSLISDGCRYTVLRHESAPPSNQNADKPDLALTRVLAWTHQVPGESVEHLPQETTSFIITIYNLGTSPFVGSVLVAYADNRADIDAHRYPLYGEVRPASLNVGDSIVVRAQQIGQWYQAGAHLAFLLRTDKFEPPGHNPLRLFGADPIPELSYDNNFTEFSVP